MESEILQGFCDEIQSLFFSTEIQVIRNTQFKSDNMPAGTIGLVVISMEDATDQHQYIGGAISGNWDFKIDAYLYDPNAEMDNDDGNSTSAYDLIGKIRSYIALGDWTTATMLNAVSTFGFKLTQSGVTKNTSMQKEGGGIIPGYSLNYISTSIDISTTWTENKTFTPTVIEGVTFVGYDETIKYIWQKDCIDSITFATYSAATTYAVGDRYWISDKKKIYEVQAVNQTTHKVSVSIIIDMVLNTIFRILTDETNVYLWDGANLNATPMMTADTEI
jgi:hypothetical protein